ncbi:hypothetical protein SDC9_113631 [bioreactor metagenome]|uniref:Uncharacterized protein n=1 Tax=bioreactor metagenome TaxID=1076179 RepID=A0A645BML1_9ZZZZ
MELSTSIPTPRARPPMVIMFSVIPAKYKRTNVVIIDIGMERAITNVVLKLLKNINSITTASIAPVIAVFFKLSMDWFM